MNRNSNHRKLAAFTALLLGAAALSGCGYRHGQNFYSDDAVRSTGEFAQAQCAAGAKDDAMLYDINFHGEKLNSLGQGKLDLILKATPVGDPVLVYLNMPHEVVAEREATVAAYLKTAGVPDTKIIVAEGVNSNRTKPTAYNLSGIYAVEGGNYNGQASKDAALPSASSSSSSSSSGH
jgi:hypothetical protein